MLASRIQLVPQHAYPEVWLHARRKTKRNPTGKLLVFAVHNCGISAPWPKSRYRPKPVRPNKTSMLQTCNLPSIGRPRFSPHLYSKALLVSYRCCGRKEVSNEKGEAEVPETDFVWLRLSAACHLNFRLLAAAQLQLRAMRLSARNLSTSKKAGPAQKRNCSFIFPLLCGLKGKRRLKAKSTRVPFSPGQFFCPPHFCTVVSWSFLTVTSTTRPFPERLRSSVNFRDN